MTAGLLASCTNPAAPAGDDAPRSALTVAVTDADTGATLERRYRGTVTVFHPEAGFAVLEVAARPPADDPASAPSR